ncbi:hypothetical protein ACFE04_026917 [Oxalis oulophora]
MCSHKRQYISTFNDFKVANLPYKSGDDDEQAPFMCSTDQESQYISTFDDFTDAKLPYESRYKRKFSMYVFLPNAKDGLPALIEKLMYGGSAFVNNHLPKTKVKVGNYRIPKFKMEFGYEVPNDDLMSGGDTPTEMTESPLLWI